MNTICENLQISYAVLKKLTIAGTPFIISGKTVSKYNTKVKLQEQSDAVNSPRKQNAVKVANQFKVGGCNLLKDWTKKDLVSKIYEYAGISAASR